MSAARSRPGMVLAIAIASMVLAWTALASKGGGRGPGSVLATNPLAGQVGAKIFVQQEGWYQLSRQALIDAGWDPGTSATYLQLWAEGVQQAILANTAPDGTLDPADTIEFYGTGLDTASTGTRVYWLVQGSSPGIRVATQTTPKGKTLPAPASFPFTATFSPKTSYVPAIVNGSVDGFYGDTVTDTPVTESITVIDPAPSTASAWLSVTLVGASWWSHNVTVELNGNLAGEMSFNGELAQTTSFSLPSSWIVAGANLVTLTAPEGGRDVSLVSSISLSYPRLFRAADDFLKCTSAGSAVLSIGGFSIPSVRAFDITAPAAPRQLLVAVSAGGGGYSATLTTPSSTGNRTVLAIGTDQTLSPAGIVANVASTLAATTNQADLVIITDPAMLSAAFSLASLRQQQGLQVAIASITDVYDEFNYGEKDSSAIKNFLRYAQMRWAGGPRYVLLLGGASLDPRNYLGYGDFDLVPTRYVATSFLRTSSDDWFVDFNDDDLPEMAIGRIPARTATEAATAISKIVGYGQAPGAPTKSALLIADANDDSGDFESASASVGSFVPSDYSVRSVLVGQLGGSAAHAAIVDDFNAGQLVVNYIGHGFDQYWSLQGVFTSGDAATLTNTAQLPFVVSMTCSTGYFQDPTETSLAASLLFAAGGGVAVWASSGLPSLLPETSVNQALFSYLFNGTNPTLGDAVVQAKAATTDSDVRRSFILFGDPTTRLAQ